MHNTLSIASDALPQQSYQQAVRPENQVNYGKKSDLPNGWWVPFAILLSIGFWASLLWWLLG
ncbi:MAG: hypothetical protein ACRBB0_04840 [Pelagimonas sp.]|uniref:hypothetical protein n=1 Tax=Pelagimonas sp. TaxID=2073170 RepID=UPI003D6B3BD8